jgi:hypothetical protein
MGHRRARQVALRSGQATGAGERIMDAALAKVAAFPREFAAILER